MWYLMEIYPTYFHYARCWDEVRPRTWVRRRSSSTPRTEAGEYWAILSISPSSNESALVKQPWHISHCPAVQLSSCPAVQLSSCPAVQPLSIAQIFNLDMKITFSIFSGIHCSFCLKDFTSKNISLSYKER
jgi:hypothetical protein